MRYSSEGRNILLELAAIPKFVFSRVDVLLNDNQNLIIYLLKLAGFLLSSAAENTKNVSFVKF